MNGFDPEFAEMRFGCGLSPTIPPAASPEILLAGLRGPDLMADRFAVETFADFLPRMAAIRDFGAARRDAKTAANRKRLEDKIALTIKEAREAQARWFGQTMLRRTYTPCGFRERLVWFWSDHFTARGKAGIARFSTSPYIEDAIRPNLNGKFEDLLIAAVTHPVMQQFLDQTSSTGPNSPRGIASGGKLGLNENLAREVLELHTLGVSGPYTQQDVRQLAEIFTGMSFQADVGFMFRKPLVEPGSETVLGVTYPDKSGMGPIRRVLRDLARHPATAGHIARKLAIHFVSDTPDPGLVSHLEARFLATKGNLSEVYAALIEHPAAWSAPFENVKFPVDFIGSALRALAIPPESIHSLIEQQIKGWFYRPLARMGQPWEEIIGPDGWTEVDGEWMTPQGLAARVEWAMFVPRKLIATLPDPRRFAEDALGQYAPAEVTFAAAAAESRSEAIGLVLCSPRFQRR